MEDLNNVLLNKSIDRVVTDTEKTDKYIPRVKKTVTYIVSGLIFDDADQILLMQEAKWSCHGLWYLPAGRMEPNETIEEAVRREVEEETGMICEPDCLVSVQASYHQWFRFNMMCSIKGGTLKTKADSESLQAKWFPLQDLFDGRNIKLRGGDIIPIIKQGHYFYKHREKLLKIRPILTSHHSLLMRLVITYCNKEGTEYHVLFCRKPTVQLPTIDIHLGVPAYKLLLETIFGKCQACLKSVLSVEHCGKPKHANDGVCISALIHVTGDDLPPVRDDDRFEWLGVSSKSACQSLEKNIFHYEGPSLLF